MPSIPNDGLTYVCKELPHVSERASCSLSRSGRDAACRANEEREKIYELDTLRQFAKNVANNREALRALLTSLKQSGSKIVAVSAPAKGMTLLNYCSLGTDFLDFVTEKSRLKPGRYTPGMNRVRFRRSGKTWRTT